MFINIKQNNIHGENSSNLNYLGNAIKINNKFIWKTRAEGFLSGIAISVIANYIYELLIR